MPVVLTIIGLVAAAAFVAVGSAFALVALSPAGGKIAALFDVGLWRFGRIERRIGPAAAAQVARYRRAFIAFLASVFGGMAAGMFAIQQSNP